DRRPPRPAWMDRSIEKRLYATDAFEDQAPLFRPSSDQPPGLDFARVAETMNANDNTSTTPAVTCRPHLSRHVYSALFPTHRNGRYMRIYFCTSNSASM